MGLRNAKTFRRCEEPLGIDAESIEIGQKIFRMLDEEHLLFNFSTASLFLASDIIQDNGYAVCTCKSSKNQKQINSKNIPITVTRFYIRNL